MTYTHNDKIESMLLEFEVAKDYMQECIRVLEMFQNTDMRDHMTCWESHLVLEKIHHVYRVVSRLPTVNLLGLKNIRGDK